MTFVLLLARVNRHELTVNGRNNEVACYLRNALFVFGETVKLARYTERNSRIN